VATNAENPTSILTNEAKISGSIAPAWHTLVLVAAILSFSIHGAFQFSTAQEPIHRLATYGITGIMELGMFG
jgi:hypothetical protein